MQATTSLANWYKVRRTFDDYHGKPHTYYQYHRRGIWRRVRRRLIPSRVKRSIISWLLRVL